MKLIDQLTFYGAYHTNPINQIIHFIFVPAILWSILVWLSSPHHPLAPYLVTTFYSSFYIYLDPLAGLLWSLLVGTPVAWSATLFASQPNLSVLGLGPYSPSLIALMVNLLSWYMQIHPGHYIFEKRKPALMDSLVQAFALAPLFVFYELLFLLGYRPELRRELHARIDKEIKTISKLKTGKPN